MEKTEPHSNRHAHRRQRACRGVLRRTAGLAALLPSVLLSASCAGRLEPAPSADRLPGGPGDGAVASAAGVRVEARVRAWRWTPRSLNRELTPILVEIENESGRELRLGYEDFAFEAVGGDRESRRGSALPPYSLEGEVTVSVRPAYTTSGFRVAPHLRGYYPASPVYGGGFAFDDRTIDDYHRQMLYREIALPTPDMLDRALAEGVVDAGGRAAGFLYFEGVTADDPPSLEFRMKLVDAKTGEGFGEIRIPFVRD